MRRLRALPSPFGLLSRFADDERGMAVVEYGLLLALIAAVMIGGLTLAGGNINGKLKSLSSTIASSPPN